MKPVAEWKRYEQLRPDELAELVRTAPVVYWPLGLLEHHGWHLPVGLDGIKAERLSIRIAERTGGVLLPTMWWGGLGGHGDFMWTLYQPEEAARAIVLGSLAKLIAFGFRVFVLIAGHYPWEGILRDHLPRIQEAHPDVLILWGTEMSIGAPKVCLPGDHAAREETSYGLSLLPELVEMAALREGRGPQTLLDGKPLFEDEGCPYPGLDLDPASPRFAQLGADPREASAERGEAAFTPLVEHLAGVINRHLAQAG